MRWFGFGTTLGIDLGTSNVLAYQHGRGIVLREPAVVAVTRAEGKLVAIGEEARQMLGRTPGQHPGGERRCRRGSSPITACVSACCGISSTRCAGGVAWCIPMCACVCLAGPPGWSGGRCWMPRMTPGRGGYIRCSRRWRRPLGRVCRSRRRRATWWWISAGARRTSRSFRWADGAGGAVRIGGQQCDEAIIRYLRREYNLVVGESMAEEVKMQVGTAIVARPGLTMEVRGRDLMDGCRGPCAW